MSDLDRNSHRNAINKPPPPSVLNFLWLELTAKCNLRCVHCYADSGPQRRLHDYMFPQDWTNVLDQAAALGCRAMQFIGGEPTMYPALPALIGRAREIGFETIEVYTNGTVFKPRVKEAFVRHRVDLAFSVYADNSNTHDSVTRQRGSLERTLASIRWALASGLSVRAAIIEMGANASETERTQRLLRDMGVTRVGVDRTRRVGRGAGEQPMEPQFGELCGACTRGKLAVTPTGEIFPCVFSRFWPVGHVRQELRTVVEGAPLQTFKDLMAKAHPKRAHAVGEPTDIAFDLALIPTHCQPGPKSCMPVLDCSPDLTGYREPEGPRESPDKPKKPKKPKKPDPPDPPGTIRRG